MIDDDREDVEFVDDELIMFCRFMIVISMFIVPMGDLGGVSFRAHEVALRKFEYFLVSVELLRFDCCISSRISDFLLGKSDIFIS